MRRFDTVVVTAGDAEAKFKTKLFCESATLSIATAGKKYRAIKVDGALPMLTVTELRSIIDTCAAFMDVKIA